ncbi:hypothetical protein ACFL1B_03970 [Nanoarchaeota archaeon]
MAAIEFSQVQKALEDMAEADAKSRDNLIKERLLLEMKNPHAAMLPFGGEAGIYQTVTGHRTVISTLNGALKAIANLYGETAEPLEPLLDTETYLPSAVEKEST